MSTYTSKSGVALNDEDIHEIADELEAGLEVILPTKPQGRPRLSFKDSGHSPLLSVRVTDDLLLAIRTEASQTGVTVSEVVRLALEEHTGRR